MSKSAHGRKLRCEWRGPARRVRTRLPVFGMDPLLIHPRHGEVRVKGWASATVPDPREGAKSVIILSNPSQETISFNITTICSCRMPCHQHLNEDLCIHLLSLYTILPKYYIHAAD